MCTKEGALYDYHHKDVVSLDSPTGAGTALGFTRAGSVYRAGRKVPKVAMIATHYNVDFSEHYLAEYMASRGIGFLGWNTRYRGLEHFFLLEHALIDIGQGVKWLREQAGVEQVVLLGNSGGAR